MKQCTIYVPIKDYNKIIDAIQSVFNDKNIEILKDKFKVKVTYKRLFCSSSITFTVMTKEHQPEEFENMMNEMYNYFNHIQTVHNQTKDRLLKQIIYLNACIGIVAEKEINDEVFKRIKSIMKDVSGILFVPTGAMIDNRGKVILDIKGHSEVDDFIIIASSDLLDGLVKPTKLAEERKQRSIETLKEKNIPYIEHLPVLVGDEEAVVRSKEEVAKRVIALALIVTYASELAGGGRLEEAREFMQSLIGRYDAEDFFTNEERTFLMDDAPDNATLVQFSWQYECLWVLLWSLGYVEELKYPDNICDVQAAIAFIQNADTREEFTNKSTFRYISDILDQADLIYRYNWACVDSRVRNAKTPGNLDSEVVMERHRALNWLTCYMDQGWDDVTTDT